MNAVVADSFGIRYNRPTTFEWVSRRRLERSSLSGVYGAVYQPQPERELFRLALNSAYENLQRLRTRTENWDGHGSASPKDESIACADEILQKFFYCSLEISTDWITPHISSSESGVATLEWWAKDKKLTIYADQAAPTYIKVWGADIDDEMEDGVLHNQSHLSLWRWLFA
jgi:hypothetical protein